MAEPKEPIPRANEEHRKQEKLKEFPLGELELEILHLQIKRLWKNEFKKHDSVTEEELQIGARLARNYGYHVPPDPPKDEETPGNSQTVEIPVTESEDGEDEERPNFTKSINSVTEFVEDRVWAAITIQQSKKLWKEPKDLLITILACCMASITQGWDQAANGNLKWPQDLLGVEVGLTGPGVWKFGAVNAIMWFSAAILGPFLVDPICYSRFFGRRGSVMIAAAFSLASSIGASRATSWQGYLVARFFLGIGIGAKASIVPIWESEVLPPAKRGRVLVSWQVFTAIGIFAGSVATYIFRDSWRNQVLSGALPALILFILTYLCCESPRWLIIQGKYVKAFETLVRLRKERLLAAEEFCYIYFQIQNERSFARHGKKADLNHSEPKISYGERLPKIWTVARNFHAAQASAIVMLSQQLSGINILAFLASVFFTAANLTDDNTSDPVKRNLGLSIGFGAANAVFSAIAYFLIEPLPHDLILEDIYGGDESSDKAHNDGAPKSELERKKEIREKERQERLIKLRRLLYGRRRLLLQSLAGGTLMLFILTFLLKLPASNSHKLGAVTAFVFLFTLCYSPGAGAVPFLYSAEIWPNEGKEIGMSWAVSWNFLGSGFLALFVPRGLAWSGVKLFGLFTGFSFIGFLLVYFFVPSTGNARSLEDMSTIFRTSLYDHSVRKTKHIAKITDLAAWFPYNFKPKEKKKVPPQERPEVAPGPQQATGLPEAVQH